MTPTDSCRWLKLSNISTIMCSAFACLVHCGVEAFSVEQMGPSYLVRTSEGNYNAENVVIATGLYQSPKIPSYSEEIAGAILQMHSMHYRNPATLPQGAVLVVGTGQSGAQIAQELYQSGRKVYLSIGSAGRVPRRTKTRTGRKRNGF